MSLLSMATNGLNQFASRVNNTVVQAVSAVNGIVSTVKNTIGAVNNLIGTFRGFGNNSSGGGFENNSSILFGSQGNKSSYAGNYRQAGNSQDGTIFDFLSHFKSGIMKSNRFRIEFTLPKGVSGSTGMYSVNSGVKSAAMRSSESGFNGQGSINLKCHTASLPMRSLQTLDFKCNSTIFKVPYMTSYDPISLTFYADGNMDTREYFELWQSAVMNFGNNTINFYSEYISDVKLYVQNESGADVYGIILYECFPISIGMLDMSYASTNMPLNIQIMLSFKSWIPMSNSNADNFNRTV